jgi:perosamine synthetase
LVGNLSVPLCKPSIDEDEIKKVGDVLRGGWLAHGAYNHEFEEEFAAYIGVKHAVSMNSCTSALEASLKVANIKKEVIIPSMTWVSTANCVLSAGATPVFCEVDPATRNVTAETIRSKLTENTEALIVVHFAGQICEMDEILELCDEHNLFLVEDSAETLGATYKGKQAGSFGVGCFSFFPTKNITTAEGGMLTSNDDEFARKCRAIIGHGISSTTFAREKLDRPWLRAAEMVGHNYRMPNPLACLGLSQLRKLDTLNQKRQTIASLYDNALQKYGDKLRSPVVRKECTHVYQMYSITVDAELRNPLVKHLNDNGVGASVHFDPPVHAQPYYKEHFPKTALPVTDQLATQIVTLPIFPDMKITEVNYVSEIIDDFMNKKLD